MEQTFPVTPPAAIPVARGRARALVEKARDAALAAVAAYNNPTARFKSGTYVVLMHVAWTSLLLAILHRNGVAPYRRRAGTRFFEKIDGRRRVWELRECLRQCWAGNDDAVSQNLRFFIGLRDIIEHADAPEVDLDIFGECQALLFNFESVLVREFGNRYSLNASLAMALQFSERISDEARRSVQKQFKLVSRDLRRYIDAFRGALSTDVLNDMKYSYKVFLIPMTGNHRSKDMLAIEFMPYDPTDLEQDRIVTLIKPRTISIVNADLFKPMAVIREVSMRITPRKLNNNIHAAAYRYWGVRPDDGAIDPTVCDSRYCSYDKWNHNYIYTRAWIEFLVEQFRDESTFNMIAARVRRGRRGQQAVPDFLRTDAAN
jgi:hypothetical protein